MVQGFEGFKKWFAGFEKQYTIIGGTACDLLMTKGGQYFRATRDIDIILILEAMTPEFGIHFWNYVKTGEYTHLNKSTGEPQFYRFSNPGKPGFPVMIELFSRNVDGLNLPKDAVLTPLHIDDEISSISAILLDTNYYQFLNSGTILIDGVPLLDVEYIIPFKSRAWLDLNERRAAGENVDSRNLRKHKNDLFRLSTLLTPESKMKLPSSIMNDLNEFLVAMQNETIDTKNLGIVGKDKEALIQIITDTYI